LKSDGTTVACGRNSSGQCDLPAEQYLVNPAHLPVSSLVLQLVVGGEGFAVLHKMSGQEVDRITCRDTDLLSDISQQLLDTIGNLENATVILPSGEILSGALARNPSISIATLLSEAHPLKKRHTDDGCGIYRPSKRSRTEPPAQGA